MAIGIVHILSTITDLQETAVDGIALAKAAARGPFGLGQLFAAVIQVAGDVKALITDAPAALPEFEELDSAEVGQIGAASYDCVKAIMAALIA